MSAETASPEAAGEQLARLATRLRSRGLRVTSPRLAVLAVLEELAGHPDAETIGAAVRRRLGAVSGQAVYDILAAFTQHGLVRRIEPAGSAARFEIRVGDNHHHLVCRACGRMVDVDCAAGEPRCLHPSETAGFEIDQAEIIFWGLCPDCQQPTKEERR